MFELKPDEIDSLRLRSKSYSLNGKHMEAIEDMNLIIDRTLNSCQNQVDLAREYEKLGDYYAAIEHLRRGLSYSRNNCMAWSDLARIHSMATDPEFLDGEKAKRYAAKAVKCSSSYEEGCLAWDTFGAALAETGDFERAIKAAKKAWYYTDDKRTIAEIETRIIGYERQQPARFKVAAQSAVYTKRVPIRPDSAVSDQPVPNHILPQTQQEGQQDVLYCDELVEEMCPLELPR